MKNCKNVFLTNLIPVKKTAVVTSLKMIGKQANLSVALLSVRRPDNVSCLYIYFPYFCRPWSVELSNLIQPKNLILFLSSFVKMFFLNSIHVKKTDVVTSLMMIGKQANLSVALWSVRRPDSVSCLYIYFSYFLSSLFCWAIHLNPINKF